MLLWRGERGSDERYEIMSARGKQLCKMAILGIAVLTDHSDILNCELRSRAIETLVYFWLTVDPLAALNAVRKGRLNSQSIIVFVAGPQLNVLITKPGKRGETERPSSASS